MVQRFKDILSFALHFVVGRLCSVFPVNKDLIVFCNYNGRGYGDNLAPVAAEILRRGIPCSLAWLVSDETVDMPDGIKKIKKGWFREKFYLSRARLVISNVKGLKYKKKANAFYLQTWHGDMPFKHIEAECGEMLSWYYRKSSQLDSKMTDYVLSGSSFFSSVARSSFWYPEKCEILEFGIPRNDVFFRTPIDEISKFKIRHFGDAEVRIALYAPTFREHIPNESCVFDMRKLVQRLEKRFGGHWIVVVRLHPVVADKSDMYVYDDCVVDGTTIEEGQLLSLASDILISDYSSIVEEFVLQKKPVYLFVKDLNEYIEKERKLRELYFRLPFDSCRTEDDLFAAIDRFDDAVYQAKLCQFVSHDYRVFDDGHASERVVDLIEKLLDDGSDK